MNTQKPRKYWLFAWLKGSGRHGMQDLAGEYDDLDRAILVGQQHWDYYQILDITTGQIANQWVEYMDRSKYKTN